jgi:hypothetical protein
MIDWMFDAIDYMFTFPCSHLTYMFTQSNEAMHEQSSTNQQRSQQMTPCLSTMKKKTREVADQRCCFGDDVMRGS